jgi:hypothetical protein
MPQLAPSLSSRLGVRAADPVCLLCFETSPLADQRRGGPRRDSRPRRWPGRGERKTFRTSEGTSSDTPCRHTARGARA